MWPASRPPYAFGHDIVSQPRSASFLANWRLKANSSSDSSSRSLRTLKSGGRLARRNSRTSWRKAFCSGVKAKSIAPFPVAWPAATAIALAALELRLALLRECAWAFFGVFSRLRDDHRVLGEVKRLVEANLAALVDEALGELDRHGRPLGEACRERACLRQQPFRRIDAADIADAQRLLCIDHIAGPDQFERLGEANDARQEESTAIAGDDPHAHVGHAEARCLRGEADIGHRGHIHARARRRTVDGGDVRLVEELQRPRHAVHVVSQAVAALCRSLLAVQHAAPTRLGLHVHARAEPASGAGQ